MAYSNGENVGVGAVIGAGLGVLTGGITLDSAHSEMEGIEVTRPNEERRKRFRNIAIVGAVGVVLALAAALIPGLPAMASDALPYLATFFALIVASALIFLLQSGKSRK